jgi:hypothetical protein
MKLAISRWAVAGAAMVALGSWVGWRAAAGHVRSAAEAAGAVAVAKIAGAGGVTAVSADGSRVALAEGGRVGAGARVETDARTRVRLELADGTAIALDRASTLRLDRPGRLSLAGGALVADLAPGASLEMETPAGAVRAHDARVALTADDDRTSVEVARGDAEIRAAGDAAVVHAGEAGDVTRGAKRVTVTAANDLAQRVATGLTDLDGDTGSPSDAPPGLGSLRARKPGAKDEIDGAVRLARHQVTARIAGAMARTEVDETFVNTTDQELEGVWRFPLPADARLERLALEVDGKLIEGEFVDANRASGIWRGVIQHAAPHAPKPVEEVVWVPGPWRDPALLEWQRGGRAELKIFPIPRKGSRRVVVAYTQHVEPAGGVRRYVYPLATGAAGGPVEEASFDVQVLGAEPGAGVRAHGYDLAAREGEARGARLAMTRRAFVPSGDLAIEYATADLASEASAFAFAPAGESPFVALTLRPKLPSRVAARGRDQVLVVDRGRAMFGERLRRASGLTAAIVQQMDRRDRVTVLACDLSCRPMPGGWLAPGAAAAHDVEAFLAGMEADGATDLVGAVRAAAHVPGRDPGHDVRVVLLSDGVAAAGYRSAARLSAEVADALPDERSAVVAVPIGSDGDLEALGEIARGGGGAVVPYSAAESLDAAALQVLSATYGAMLRDVELTVPDAITDVAPARLAPIRAGAEAIVTARLRADAAAGEVVLRGKLAGEPYEARWPIDVRASADEGNAWTARAWAAMRVADDERGNDGAARADAVALSRRFHVPSRFTSLLVLESEAMFRAFGIARSEPAFAWSGESEAQGTQVVAAGDDAQGAPKEEEAPSLGALASPAKKAAPSPTPPLDPSPPAAFEARSEADSASSLGGGGAAGPGDRRAFPAPTASASPNAGALSVARPAPLPPPPLARPILPRDASWGPARRGRWMRRVWFRTAAVAEDRRPVVDPRKLDVAREAIAAAPDQRQGYANLARLMVQDGDGEALDALVARWAARDPLDADALAARAASRAWRGDRDGSLRVASGMLASPAMTPAAQFEVASALARAEERAGRAGEACALRVTAAEAKPGDSGAVAAAVACERSLGHAAAEARWMASLKDDATRARVSAAAAKLTGSGATEAISGDVAIDATWDAGAGADLDLAVIDPSGRRLAWASAARGVRAADVTSLAHEALGLSSSAQGPFVVEVVRASAPEAVGQPPEGRGRNETGGLPVSGRLRITALGRTQLVPFVLTGSRAQVARVDVRLASRLEPVADGIAFGACDPPFFVDAQGMRRMKPGCL